ncbi:MAG: (2Fe-2S)-binding protein [Lacipirellulaceae bacterium]
MQPDDELCLCFHVTRRKVENYLRVERPASPSQLSECYGAGTGCGWCRPLLRRLFDAHRARIEPTTDALPDAAGHRAGRSQHVREGGGTPPPGATPV